MSTRDEPWSEGTPCWMDLMVADPAAAAEFYGEIFGWDAPEGPKEFNGYRMAMLDDRPVAGISAVPVGMEGTPSVWSTYLASSDVEATAAKIETNGGSVMMAPTAIEEFGKMMVAADPSGAMFCVWQAGDHIGAQLVNEPGALVWNECLTRDYVAARAFYAEVFGYGFREIDPAMPYEALLVDSLIVGGIGALGDQAPADAPSSWMGYFSCTYADTTAEQAAELGATIVREPQQTEFGRIAILQGPQGEYFSIMSPIGSFETDED